MLYSAHLFPTLVQHRYVGSLVLMMIGIFNTMEKGKKYKSGPFDGTGHQGSQLNIYEHITGFNFLMSLALFQIALFKIVLFVFLSLS